ncbi:hypothetical protein [Salinigranum rubrum]|uniref:hypothetical protein n=1 Tax=Salinigranum rubrum TaxID=755307 RepID=UPI0013A57F57|nr:hypothetical protein [Salinigranum rubrum]
MKNTTRCPMCAQGFADRTDLRVHLMCDHRKSSLTEELLETIEARDDSRARRERPAVPVGDS